MATARVENGRIILTGPLPKSYLSVAKQIEGVKRWLVNGELSIEATRHNAEVLSCVVEGGSIDLPQRPADSFSIALEAQGRPEFLPVKPPRKYQNDCLEKAGNKTAFAVFAEMGTGKTKMAIDRAYKLWSEGIIDAAIVVAPKGVHEEWVIDHIPGNTPPRIAIQATYFSKKPWAMEGSPHAGPFWWTINFDGLNTKVGGASTAEFCRRFHGRMMLIVDESHNVKNAQTQRWKAVAAVRASASHVLILSGTPVAKSLEDYWAQYKLMDDRIIGCKYITTFRSRYCVMGGFEGRSVVGHKNQEELFALTEPYTFRITKLEGLDLPEKVRTESSFNMTPEMAHIYKQMKKNLMIELNNGIIQTAANAAVALTRLQQITSGYIPHDDGTITLLDDNPRLQTLMNCLNEIDGKVVIWCRFRADIEIVKRALGAEAVTYHGSDSPDQRRQAKEAFIDPKSSVRFMVSNPAAGGTGIDGYQHVCHHNIYYSNSFNSIHRWQSEDRTHRSGTKQNVIYTDLICRGGIDKKVLANLMDKKGVSDWILDDIRRMINDDA